MQIHVRLQGLIIVLGHLAQQQHVGPWCWVPSPQWHLVGKCIQEALITDLQPKLQHVIACREMQQHVASLQAELSAAQAAAGLEATINEFRGYLEDGENQF